MKKFKIVLLFLSLLMTSTIILSCGNNTTATEQTGKEYTSAYICPMHCDGSGSNQPGKCPVCGMTYKKNDKHKNEGHDHDDHEGHNH